MTKKNEKLPPIKPGNFHLRCARCKETLGGHLGYRCIDDKGNFVAEAALKEGDTP